LSESKEFCLWNWGLYLDSDSGVGVGQPLLDAPVEELTEVTDEMFPQVGTGGFALGGLQFVFGLANQFVGEVLESLGWENLRQSFGPVP
jgi:hypothetical protein